METMVKACITLHNMLRTPGADDVAVSEHEDEQHSVISGSCRDGAVVDDMERRL